MILLKSFRFYDWSSLSCPLCPTFPAYTKQYINLDQTTETKSNQYPISVALQTILLFTKIVSL